MNAFLESLYMICYMYLIHTDELSYIITKIQGITGIFVNMVITFY